MKEVEVDINKAYELLEKYKENLFAVEFVSDEEAKMLYKTILFWRYFNNAYFEYLDKHWNDCK